jgi:hypothetical protein
MDVMTEPTSFPLRMRDPRMRQLVREVAQRDHLSQNALIEQAVANEVVVRGGLIAAELASAAGRLAQMSAPELERAVAASIEDFAAGEARPEPLRPSALHGVGAMGLRPPTPDGDPLGVMTAFHSGS